MSLILRPYYAIRLFVVFLWDLTASSIQVAQAVIANDKPTKPRLVTVPLEVTSPLEIMLVSNFITLTPGTLTVDVSDDRKTILVHDLFAGDRSEPTIESVRNGIEARVLKATRS